MTQMNNTKIIIIGLDGATFDLFDCWVKEKTMSAFETIKEQGAFGELTSMFPPISTVAWASFMTGKNPGKHSIFDFVCRENDSCAVKLINSTNICGKTIWDILSENNKKLGIINVPLTYPPSALNGFMLTGFLTPPSEDLLRCNFTFPFDLKQEIKAKLSDYFIVWDKPYQKDKEEFFFAGLKRELEMRARATSYFMDSREWDLFMVVFNGTDTIQHNLWHLMNPVHSRYDEFEANKSRVFVQDFFKKLNQIIAQFLCKLDNKTTLIVMSDHGGGVLDKRVYLNNWLRAEGWLTFKAGFLSRLKQLIFNFGITPQYIYEVLNRIGITRNSINAKVNSKRSNSFLRKIFLSFDEDIDWTKTKAYSRGHVGQIYVNLKGREPHGIVEPGPEYEQLRLSIKRVLLKLRDPENNEFIVDKVCFKEDLYSGYHLESAPDILIFFRDFKYQAVEVSPYFLTNKIMVREKSGMSGNHRMNGVLLMKGPGIKKGFKIQNAILTDIAPTVLYQMGIAIPVDMDGKVLVQAFEEDYLKANPIRYNDCDTTKKGWTPSFFGEKEEAVIKNRLENLGYMG